MAYLGTYIQEILKRKQNVTLPGFGTLVVTKTSGKESIEGRIAPPGFYVSFDEKKPKEDDILARVYADGEGLEIEEARQQVLELIDAIKFKLDKGERFSLEALGEFSRDDNNRIHFKKSSEWTIDPDSFGLEPLDLLELEEEARESKSPTDSVTDEPADYKTDEIVTEPVTAAVSAKKPLNKWKIIWIVVGGLIVVLIAILLIPANNEGVEFGKEGIIIRNEDHDNTVQPDSRTDDSGIKGESGDINAESDEKAFETQNTPNQEVNNAEKPVERARQADFYIIYGSFKNLLNATELKDELVKSGFPAEIIYTDNRLYRVSIKSYTTKEEALNDLPMIKSRSGINSLWIMEK